MFHYSMSGMLDMFEDEYAAQKNAKLKKEKAAK